MKGLLRIYAAALFAAVIGKLLTKLTICGIIKKIKYGGTVMYGNYYYGSSTNVGAILAVIFVILALAGGIVLYFTVFNKKNDGKYTGFMKWLYDFVHFRVLTIEAIMKITYLFAAISVTLTSFLWFEQGLMGLLLCPLQIILGNVITRIAYEFALMLIIITRNTTEINSKLKNENGEAAKNIFDTQLPTFEKKAKPAAGGSKFCSGCGKALDANAKFCDGCGKKCE